MLVIVFLCTKTEGVENKTKIKTDIVTYVLVISRTQVLYWIYMLGARGP